MKTEKAYYISSLRGLGKIPAGYSRVYFGAEFCQWRLPGPQTAVNAYNKAREAGLGFTLMTPWVTDVGIKKLRALFKALVSNGAGGVEVVVNDLGVLMLLRKEFRGLVPVLGRLLVKQKRCPRVPGIMDELPEAGREVYLRSNIDDPVTAAFYRKMGIKRVELDNPLQGIEADLKGVRLKGSVYAPYAYVTTTRHCPASYDDRLWQSLSGCKLKGCARNILKLSSPEHEAPLIMRGNTQFVRNDTLPDDLKAMGIDRIVHMEDVP